MLFFDESVLIVFQFTLLFFPFHPLKTALFSHFFAFLIAFFLGFKVSIKLNYRKKIKLIHPGLSTQQTQIKLMKSIGTQ